MGYDKHSKTVTNFPNYTVRTDGKVFNKNEKHAYANSLRRSYLTYFDRKNGAIISKEKRRKPVKVIETGIIYPSVLDCAKDLGCYKNGVAGCCNGIYKQHHNYHFEWAKEEQK